MIVLGLDAAWTPRKESGCAVIAGKPGNWTCLAAFSRRMESSDVLAAAMEAAGTLPDLVSVDMPLGRVPVIARRACDNALSRAFGARGCAVHSSTPERPGRVSADLMAALSESGYELAVSGSEPRNRQVIEVYPHIAVMQLIGADYRVPYKIGRVGQYWPEASTSERKRKLRRILGRILRALEERIGGIALQLPRADAGPTEFKRFEDALDGVVCAWIGALYVEGKCSSYGDESAAIWAPNQSGCGPDSRGHR